MLLVNFVCWVSLVAVISVSSFSAFHSVVLVVGSSLHLIPNIAALLHMIDSIQFTGHSYLFEPTHGNISEIKILSYIHKYLASKAV